MRDEKQIEIKIGRSRLIAVAVFAGALLVFLGVLRWITSAGDGRELRAREVVVVQPPVPVTDEPQRAFVAVALSEQAVDMSAQASGIVEALLVEMGTPVKANTPLARLQSDEVTRDAAEAAAAAKQAEAESSRAEAELTNAQQRLATRKVEGVVSADERQQAEIAVKVAEANFEVAKQKSVQAGSRAAKARYRQEQLTLRAPFDGALAARYQNVGTAVQTGTRIVRFVGARRPLVRFAVPHEQAQAMTVGEKVAFRADASERTVPLAIARVAPEADPHSGLVVVEANFVEGGDDLRPGTVGRVELALGGTLK